MGSINEALGEVKAEVKTPIEAGMLRHSTMGELIRPKTVD
jgi:hypothetical protein